MKRDPLCRYCGQHVPMPCVIGCLTLKATANVRSQQEIVADLHDRADKLEHSARTARHTKANKLTLQVAARVLRVAAIQNSIGFDLDEKENDEKDEKDE